MTGLPGNGTGGYPSPGDLLVEEAEAYVHARLVIGCVEAAVSIWRKEGWTIGQFLTVIAAVDANRARRKSWAFLDQPPA
ncbi:MAG TPA: hypothetical protein VHT75_20305 [Acidimicrobiales bacterium]|nr:hypothetical protein [Acidimicrobiales bacterium]